jgi:hypothetical protein
LADVAVGVQLAREQAAFAAEQQARDQKQLEEAEKASKEQEQREKDYLREAAKRAVA